MKSRSEIDEWGIASGYKAGDGSWRETAPETRDALRAAMGNELPAAAVRVVTEDKIPRFRAGTTVVLEDGSRIQGGAADIPLGYHWLERREKRERLIVCPRQCYLPDDLWDWGWSVQLHSLRSARSWGAGDLADLRELATWSRDSFGSGSLLVNPLLAPAPVPPVETSPYYPSSRCFRNPLYLRIDEIPGAAEAGAHEFMEAGRALNESPLIERDTVLALKLRALEKIWARFRGSAEFDAFRTGRGVLLERFACYCVLAERFGASWRAWPEKFRNPESVAVARILEEEAERVGFHEWIQWLLDAQLQRVCEATRVIQDLPIGFSPDGADAWLWKDLLASGVSVGAPPDAFNARGQDWGLPPFVPRKLRAAGYEPFIQTLRASLRENGGLRIDHVMGLSRLFWIPRDPDAAAGAYVHYPEDDLLRIVALESHRAKAVIIGEDLGIVDPAFRRKLRRHRVLSYGVLWFERSHPALWREELLASVNTHDLPTIAGVWSGSDLVEQEKLGLQPSRDGMRKLRSRLPRLTKSAPGAPVEDVISGAHRLISRAPARLAVAALDDALAMERRPNVPGTSTERPNWSIPLEQPLESLMADPLVRVVGREMAAGRAEVRAARSGGGLRA